MRNECKAPKDYRLPICYNCDNFVPNEGDKEGSQNRPHCKVTYYNIIFGDKVGDGKSGVLCKNAREKECYCGMNGRFYKDK